MVGKEIASTKHLLIHTYLRLWMSYDELKGDLKYWKRKMRKKDIDQAELKEYMKGLRGEIKELNERINKLGLGSNELDSNQTIDERLNFLIDLLNENIDSLKPKNKRSVIKILGYIIDSFEAIIDMMNDINLTKEVGFTIIKAHNKASKRFFIIPGDTPFTKHNYNEINEIIENNYYKGISGPYDIYKDLCKYYGVEPYPKDVIDKHLERKRY